MRIRSVSPDLCVSEPMAHLPAELERTFVRLWTHCDDEGRCVDNARLIKAAIYPLVDEMTPKRVDGELEKLAAVGLIVRYEAGGKRFLAVRSWEEYQHPQRPSPSKCPKPPEPDMTPRVHVAEHSANGHGALHAGEGVGEGVGEGEGVTPLSTSSTGLAVVEQPAEPRPVEAVFDAWRDSTGHHKAILDQKRRRCITQALKNYPLADVLDAVRGWRHSPHHRGENPARTVYNGLDLLLRDSEHLERFRDLERGEHSRQPAPVAPVVPKSWESLRTMRNAR